jgi:hypothetical protein
MSDRLTRDQDCMIFCRDAVEHLFGTIEAWTGGSRFVTCWLTDERSTIAPSVLACSPKRMVALIGVRGPMRAKQG